MSFTALSTCVFSLQLAAITTNEVDAFVGDSLMVYLDSAAIISLLVCQCVCVPLGANQRREVHLCSSPYSLCLLDRIVNLCGYFVL